MLLNYKDIKIFNITSQALLHKHLALLVLLLTTLGICKISTFIVVCATDPDRIFFPDSEGYTATARAVLKTGRFAVSPDSPDIPQIERTPGYPLFVASLFFLFGERYSPLVIVQIFASLGTIVLVYCIAASLWNPTTGLSSALLLSLDFPSFVNSQQVLTDTPFTFLFTLAIGAGIWALNRSTNFSLHLVLLHGVLLALATLIRPIAYYAIVPVIVAFLFTLKHDFNWQWKNVVLTLLVLLLPWILFVGGWQLRNYAVSGSAGFSHVVGWNLLFCRGAGIIAQRDGISIEEARQSLGYGRYTELHPETADWSIPQIDRRWKREGLHLILQHPRLFLKSVLQGALRMMFGTGWRELVRYIAGSNWQNSASGSPTGDLFRLPLKAYFQRWLVGQTGWLAIFVFAESYLFLFYLCCLYSGWRTIRTWNTLHRASWIRGTHILIGMIIIYLFVVSVAGGPEAYFRFRIPIMPLLALYAGHGMSRGLIFVRNHIRRF